jgi:DNA-binding XRE family transcriptional regulator
MNGKELKSLRNLLGVTRQQLAEALHIKGFTINTWEINLYDRPVPQTREILKYFSDLQKKREGEFRRLYGAYTKHLQKELLDAENVVD